MRGHEEASGTAYIPDQMFEEWAAKDPILRFENYLKEHHGQHEDYFKQVKEDFKEAIKADVQKALDCPLPDFDEKKEKWRLYLSRLPMDPTLLRPKETHRATK